MRYRQTMYNQQYIYQNDVIFFQSIKHFVLSFMSSQINFVMFSFFNNFRFSIFSLSTSINNLFAKETFHKFFFLTFHLSDLNSSFASFKRFKFFFRRLWAICNHLSSCINELKNSSKTILNRLMKSSSFFIKTKRSLKKLLTRLKKSLSTSIDKFLNVDRKNLGIV